MLQKLRSRLYSEEKGFTLIELLVVVLIIGILAAIALPAFLGQRAKGQDASAKSNARNLVSEIESCFSREESYANAGCTDVTQANTGLPIPAEVNWAGGAGTGAAATYTVTATSASNNTFVIGKLAGATPTRTCTVAAGANRGGCPASGVW